jgi:hypothetical protein
VLVSPDLRVQRGSLRSLPTLVQDPQPAEFERLLERRRELGLDLFDEVWEGVLHMNPAPHSRHGKVDGELARLLYEPARKAGLSHTGPINLGEADEKLPFYARCGSMSC